MKFSVRADVGSEMEDEKKLFWKSSRKFGSWIIYDAVYCSGGFFYWIQLSCEFARDQIEAPAGYRADAGHP